jgi:hypothetical protein
MKSINRNCYEKEDGYILHTFCFLTLSCPGGPLGVLLTLAIYISPNNVPIDLHPNKETIVHVLSIHFCTLHYVSWTIIDEVTVPLIKGVVGLLVG